MIVGALSPDEFRSVICFLRAKHLTANYSHRQLAEVYFDGVITAHGSWKGCRVWENVRRDVLHTDRSGRPDISRINMNSAGIQGTILGQSNDILNVVSTTVIRKCDCTDSCGCSSPIRTGMKLLKIVPTLKKKSFSINQDYAKIQGHRKRWTGFETAIT